MTQSAQEKGFERSLANMDSSAFPARFTLVKIDDCLSDTHEKTWTVLNKTRALHFSREAVMVMERNRQLYGISIRVDGKDGMSVVLELPNPQFGGTRRRPSPQRTRRARDTSPGRVITWHLPNLRW